MSSPPLDLKHKPSTSEEGSSASNTLYQDALPEDLDPYKWSNRRKWLNVWLIAAQATLSPVCSTLLAAGALQVDEDLHVRSPYVTALPVALFVLGLGLGTLFLAPLSEMYGRRIVYIVSFGVFSILNIGCALVKNEAGLIVLRFLAGLAGRYAISICTT
jgi:MFS family permease